MRKELDRWSFVVSGEPSRYALARLLVAFEELRVRLNPKAYPNLELSDEGYLWFNVDSPPGNWEVLALPFGLGDLEGPALAVSFPHRPQDLGRAFPETLFGSRPLDANWTPFAAFSTREEILTAYEKGVLPALHLLTGKERLLAEHGRVDFWCYFGVYIPIAQLAVQDVERSIRQILSKFLPDPPIGEL